MNPSGARDLIEGSRRFNASQHRFDLSPLSLSLPLPAVWADMMGLAAARSGNQSGHHVRAGATA